MKYVFYPSIIMLGVAFALAAGAWLWLLAAARRRPWEAKALRGRRRHLEIVALLCLATTALFGAISRSRAEPALPTPVIFSVAANTESGPPPPAADEIVRFEVGGFCSGYACEDHVCEGQAQGANASPMRTADPDLGDMREAVRSQIQQELEIDRHVDPGEVAWAVVVGGHDRAHYLGGLYDSNMDLAFARARCVAEELKKHLSKPAEKADSKPAASTSEIHVLTAPGGARFGARVGPDAGRDNPSDRIVEAFVYLQPEKEG